MGRRRARKNRDRSRQPKEGGESSGLLLDDIEADEVRYDEDAELDSDDPDGDFDGALLDDDYSFDDEYVPSFVSKRRRGGGLDFDDWN